MPGNEPDCVSRLRLRHENAIRLRNAGAADHIDRIPALYPVAFAYRAKQGKNGCRIADESLRIGSGNSVWLPDLHEDLSIKWGGMCVVAITTCRQRKPYSYRQVKQRSKTEAGLASANPSTLGISVVLVIRDAVTYSEIGETHL